MKFVKPPMWPDVESTCVLSSLVCYAVVVIHKLVLARCIVGRMPQFRISARASYCTHVGCLADTMITNHMRNEGQHIQNHHTRYSAISIDVGLYATKRTSANAYIVQQAAYAARC